ncbi:Succinate dehydrogenase assembly factor 3, mitochondrial [Merluccius polli]|uniref:Succinate dehydrogenase assembly factor 3, mitochondrial n=1 Tax=Merluccius polli TaxID=89951 RepID=A0AA47P4S0_MERPO|nr:Succinate dehydrogenase assembly factor 3, mitochondrial [Merluccius polli]
MVVVGEEEEEDEEVLQDWPAQSPDMNIIEHVWGRMKEGAWKTDPKKNLDELWEACKTAFFAIPDDFINKLYESLSHRMESNCMEMQSFKLMESYKDTLQTQVLDSSGHLIPRSNLGAALTEEKFKDFQDEQIGQLYELMLESTKPNRQFDIQEDTK